MAEAVESQTASRRSPASYGDPAAEYEAVRGGGAGLFDLSARGRIEVSGAEAVQFLNGMLTNDVKLLEEGTWIHAAFPNPQGRLLASTRILKRNGAFLFDTEAVTYPTILKHLERFTLAGDFRVRDLTAETALLSVQGARAAEFVGTVLGADAAATARGRATRAPFGEGHVTVIRATHTSEDGFDMFVDAADAEALRDALVTAGARPVGHDALEILRVEAGLPRYGVDASDANVVLEVVDESEAVSYTKGCYAGQEIIARIHWRGHVAKRLAGIIFDLDAEPPTDARLRDGAEGREAGRITSSVFSPRLQSRVALALVKYDFLAPGTELKIFSGDSEVCAARIAELPLVRGSWYAREETSVGESE
ncbi:MAG: hypothetical protein QOH49_2819 [Acidobacteriota bacterium]|jgi:folate-binding protein YgfZ|nr:hypothetical protein [Acidobacteriota bacterium]